MKRATIIEVKQILTNNNIKIGNGSSKVSVYRGPNMADTVLHPTNTYTTKQLCEILKNGGYKTTITTWNKLTGIDLPGTDKLVTIVVNK